nr:benzyl alcohol O-benzoyltransferase-like [Coffea arabica]
MIKENYLTLSLEGGLPHHIEVRETQGKIKGCYWYNNVLRECEGLKVRTEKKTKTNNRVTRQKPELVRPAKSTPRECKLLSDIDDQEGLRFQIPVIQFYRSDDGQECAGRKLVVDCTGEGVMFIEADAEVTLEQFGEELQPPFPCLEELLYDVPESAGVLHCNSFEMRGFHLRTAPESRYVRCCRTSSVHECGRRNRTGSFRPICTAVWQRELLNARDPPRVTCTHHEYDEVADTKGTIIPLDDMVHRSFFFGPTEVSALRKSIPLDISRKCSTFEILTACLWRCRTIALQPEPNEEVRVLCIVNARSKFDPPLPQGYYGNAFAFPVALTTAGELCKRALGCALELVNKAKCDVTEDYMKSVADLMVIKGRPHFTVVRTYLVSDVTRAGFNEVDFGWGKPAYGGPAKGGVGAIPGVASFYIPFKNKNGEKGIVVPICLPGFAMDAFVRELENLLSKNHHSIDDHSAFVRSAL